MKYSKQRNRLKSKEDHCTYKNPKYTFRKHDKTQTLRLTTKQVTKSALCARVGSRKSARFATPPSRPAYLSTCKLQTRPMRLGVIALKSFFGCVHKLALSLCSPRTHRLVVGGGHAVRADIDLVYVAARAAANEFDNSLIYCQRVSTPKCSP
jgi:hypothetical protein